VEREIARRGRNCTPGKRRRFHRDLVICTAYRAGLAHRLIADALEMPPGQVFAVLKKAQLVGDMPVLPDSGETEEAGA
jgi:hypothetical protein